MAVLDYEFIDCESVSIQYQPNGLVNVSFTVVANSSTLAGTYNTVTFGGVTYNGYVTGYNPQQITGTNGWEHQFSMVTIGC